MEPPPQISSSSSSPKKSFVTSLMAAAHLRTPSFKEDTYFISDLKPSERKALQDLRHRLAQSPDSMWGIPLSDDRADVILLKFLRARDFRAQESLDMLARSLAWRKEFEADVVLEEDLGFKELEGVVAYMHGHDRRGHPVCYNAYGVFKDKVLYDRIFGDDDKLKRFLRWRVQVLERGIKLLDFKPGGVNSLIQVTDLKDMPKTELRVASNHILSLFQDNYPEMVARKIFINVPWYFSLLYSMFSPFLTQRTKSKFVISKEGNAAETLYKFIRPEDVPVQYGGLSRPNDVLNGPPKPASEFTVKGGEKVNIQIEGIEAGSTITWDIVVGGWELEYTAEFVPNAEGSYTIAVEKPRRLAANEEAVHNSYTARDAGKLVLSVDNTASRKRKVAAYRYILCCVEGLSSANYVLDTNTCSNGSNCRFGLAKNLKPQLNCEIGRLVAVCKPPVHGSATPISSPNPPSLPQTETPPFSDGDEPAMAALTKANGRRRGQAVSRFSDVLYVENFEMEYARQKIFRQITKEKEKKKAPSFNSMGVSNMIPFACGDFDISTPLR
ncbi:patellin-6 [Phtheirospermum japonicum]|uniref:Patellin-6 n=1 Tax=Phtheirospermum japonicum TaxID=374723 RepID=A0A830BZ95_9LAMI|nr:patellin-6 [Phtheirospermum japonicum]